MLMRSHREGGASASKIDPRRADHVCMLFLCQREEIGRGIDGWKTPPLGCRDREALDSRISCQRWNIGVPTSWTHIRDGRHARGPRQVLTTFGK